MHVQSSGKLLVKLKSIQGSDMLFIWYESMHIEIFTVLVLEQDSYQAIMTLTLCRTLP